MEEQLRVCQVLCITVSRSQLHVLSVFPPEGPPGVEAEVEGGFFAGSGT